MAVLFGLLSAAVYGSADFVGGLTSRRAGVALPITLWSQLLGGVILAALIPLDPGQGVTARALAWGASAGVGGGIGVAMLYRGLARGRMSVVAPITAVLAAALPLVVGVVDGERPGLLAWSGVALALAAVVLVSSGAHPPEGTGAPGAVVVDPSPDGADPPSRPVAGRPAWPERTTLRGSLLRPGVPEALIAGIGFGIWFITLARAGGDAGIWPLLGARLTSVPLLIVLGLALREGLAVPRAAWRGTLLAGVLDQAANVLYILAARRGLLSLVAVLTSLYPASTVLLARTVLGERFTNGQRVGLAAAAGGVTLIALG